jgi:hypothetical protein
VTRLGRRSPPSDNIADDASEHGSNRPQCLVRPLELFGMGIALVCHQSELAHPSIGLSQVNSLLPGQAHQLLPRPMHQLCLGREHHRLGLHRRVDNDLGEVARLGGLVLGGDTQALLNKGAEPFFPHPLPPTGLRRAIEGQLVTEELFAMYGRPRLCKDFYVPTDGSLAIVYPAFDADFMTAGLDGFREPDALSQNRTQGCAAKIGIDRARFIDRPPSRRCPLQVESFFC